LENNLCCVEKKKKKKKKKSGSFSRVRLAQHIKSGKKYAVKIISKIDGPATTEKGKEMIGKFAAVGVAWCDTNFTVNRHRN
jgi:hypothetical protein